MATATPPSPTRRQHGQEKSTSPQSTPLPPPRQHRGQREVKVGGGRTRPPVPLRPSNIASPPPIPPADLWSPGGAARADGWSGWGDKRSSAGGAMGPRSPVGRDPEYAVVHKHGSRLPSVDGAPEEQAASGGGRRASALGDVTTHGGGDDVTPLPAARRKRASRTRADGDDDDAADGYMCIADLPVTPHARQDGRTRYTSVRKSRATLCSQDTDDVWSDDEFSNDEDDETVAPPVPIKTGAVLEAV
ncbi:PREDICTED: artemin-like, partial [Priapulus caudatus]|uniref:Artemin-like n=1 Tax=Priapulus caudatus TaxID=37621 RepID=A0ABM1F4X8_PRICU